MADAVHDITLSKPLPSGVRIFVWFAYLQVLDMLTTLSFLMAGVQEANPLVRVAMRAGGSPLPGLIAVKLTALTLGIYCLIRGKNRLLERTNWFFAVLVAWNLLCLIFALGMRLRP